MHLQGCKMICDWIEWGDKMSMYDILSNETTDIISCSLSPDEDVRWSTIGYNEVKNANVW